MRRSLACGLVGPDRATLRARTPRFSFLRQFLGNRHLLVVVGFQLWLLLPGHEVAILPWSFSFREGMCQFSVP